MADDTPKGDKEKIARYLADHGVTSLDYMIPLPAEPAIRRGLTWGKGRKTVRPIKMVVKR